MDPLKYQSFQLDEALTELLSLLQSTVVTLLPLLVGAGYNTGAGLPYYASLAGVGGHLAWQISAVNLDDRADCMAKFVSNKWLGSILFSGIVLDKLLQ